MKRLPFLTLILLMLFGCVFKTRKYLQDPEKAIVEREKISGEKSYAHLGKFLGVISFEVKTKDTANFENGLVPWVTLENPELDIPGLIEAKKILIKRTIVTVLVDYPLKSEHRFEIKADEGFSRERLLNEISKIYYKVYEEEETSATIKTIPLEKRTTLYNRNETNGKYGIWGHDIADLLLSEIHVYEQPNKEIVLTLMIES